MSRVIDFVDTTTRDANQSLWGATGLTTPEVLAIAPAIDRVGYHALDFTSSTHMAVSVRYHREDPWERIRRMSEAMPNTLLTFLTTGMRFISWEPATEDVIRLVFRTVVRNGLRRVQIAEPMNDPVALAQIARLAKDEGAEEVVVGLTYSRSPVHDDEHYATRAAAMGECPDVDRLYLKDPGGLVTVERLRELAPLFIDGFAGRGPVELHSHCTISLAPQAYVEGAQLGFDALHTAVAPMANGTSQPAAETTVRNLEAVGFEHRLDLDALRETSEHFRALAEAKGLPLGRPAEYDATYFLHQVPGGVMTTMSRQLEEMRRPELFDEAIEEIERVRADFGYPIVVTPYAQFLVTQAVFNVMARHRGAERYADVPDEIVRYFLGHFGDPPAPPDPELVDRVLSSPRAAELRKVEPLSLEGAREKFGAQISDEELLLRLTMPPDQVEAMLAGAPPAGAAANGAAAPDPVVRLLRELERRPEVSFLRVEKDDTLVEWRREGSPVRLEDARGFVFDLDGTLVQRAKSHYEVIPGAPEALAALRRASRPFVIFTNASHMWPADIARELRGDGLDVRDDEVLTPICSALTYLNRRHPGARVYAFATPAVRDRLAKGGVDVLPDERAGEAEVIFVATPVQFDLQVLDDTARAITEGAALLTSSYVPAYSGANGRIFSKGSMVTAALQKATGRRPRIVGKPSRAAVDEIVAHLGVPASEIAVVGDDVALEVALGHIGGSHTVLVRSGISGAVDFSKLSKTRRPHEVIEGVGDLVARL